MSVKVLGEADEYRTQRMGESRMDFAERAGMFGAVGG